MRPPKNPFLTAKQMTILAVIGARNSDGTAVDLDQLLERLSYETTKESLQFSIRALVTRGLVAKLDLELRRSTNRRLVELTPAGIAQLHGVKAAPAAPSASIAISEAEAEIEEVLESVEGW